MVDYLNREESARRLFEFEMKNLPLYKYVIKPFTLSLIEAAIRLSNGNVSNSIILKIINIGKEMLRSPVILLDDVEIVLSMLSRKQNYRLVVATKGDLLDQERKLEKSGLAHYFHHIEVMSDKKPMNNKRIV